MDSTRIVKEATSVDSLSTKLSQLGDQSSNIDFFNSLTPGQATLISSILSALIAILVIVVTRYNENKRQRKEKYDAIKKYANPIILSSELLAWRLKEILEFNGAYLLPHAPQNGFFKYKFDSTVYRLCAVLGWIQAAKKEQSYLEGIKIKHHKQIQSSIYDFQRRLADGSHVEVSILDDLTKLFNLKHNSLKENDRAIIGVELEKIVFKYIPDSVKKNVIILDNEKQIEMIQEILDCICSKTKQSKVKKEIIEEKRVTAINEISREYCWIYRDWQSAIGDEMIEKIEGENRRFDVIGFSEFQLKHLENEWLKKVDNLFSNLDVSVDDRFDSRVQQLKQLYEATVVLINNFKSLVKKQETIPEDNLNKLKEFNKKLNDRAIEKRKKSFYFKIGFE